MPSLSAKDRVSLCQFSFADGRRCRTPRTGKNPHFCFDHAQKEARANAAESLGNDLDYFFSADYLSACDLSTALGRLIPAVIRGDVKPRTARTVAYLAQTLLQTIHLAKHEYINTFGTDGWRKSIRNSVNHNYNHRFPFTPSVAEGPAPESQPDLDLDHDHAAVAHPGFHPDPVGRGEALSSSPAQPQAQAQPPAPAQPSNPPQPAPSPQAPLPPTSAEFAQQVMAGHSLFLRSDPVGQAGEVQSLQPTPAPATAQQPIPSPRITANAPSIPQENPAQPTGPEQGRRDNPPPRPTTEPNRDAPWWDSRHLYDPPDSHLL
jgi:hypothetical protein